MHRINSVVASSIIDYWATSDDTVAACYYTHTHTHDNNHVDKTIRTDCRILSVESLENFQRVQYCGQGEFFTAVRE